MSEIELRGDDVNNFRALVRSGRIAASLSQATQGDLDRSVRHRELRRPNGFGDELRAVLSDGHGEWGALTLLRASPGMTKAKEFLREYATKAHHELALLPDVPGRRALWALIDYTVSRHG